MFGGLYGHPDIVVAAAASAEVRDAAAFETDLFAGLDAGGDFDFEFAVEGLDRLGGAERGVGKGDVEIRVDVEAVAFVARIGFHADVEIEVAARRATDAGFAAARDADRLAV